MGTITRSYRIRAYPNGAQRRLLDRWYGATRWLWNTALEIRSEAYRECGLTLTGNDPSSKRCSECQYTLDALRLDERQWKCPRCGTEHDRDINAAWNLLMQGLRQLAGRDDRDLRVDARDTCPEEILVQVLAEEARSGQRNRVCLEQAPLS
jgi:transposase